MAISTKLKKDIIVYYVVQNLAIGAIARRLNLHHKTVARYVDNYAASIANNPSDLPTRQQGKSTMIIPVIKTIPGQDHTKLLILNNQQPNRLIIN